MSNKELPFPPDMPLSRLSDFSVARQIDLVTHGHVQLPPHTEILYEGAGLKIIDHTHDVRWRIRHWKK